VLKEIAATREPDAKKALVDFDAAFCGHAAFVMSNFARALWLGLTGARALSVPGTGTHAVIISSSRGSPAHLRWRRTSPCS